MRPFFIVAVLIGTSLTAISIFTPGWRNYASEHVGIITRPCSYSDSLSGCDNWWNVSLL